MDDSRNIDGYLSRASERFVRVALAAVIILVVALLVLMVTLKGKVEHVEDQLAYTSPRGASAAEDLRSGILTVSQTVYIPVYSHVYIHEGTSYNLTTTLSVRNCDLSRSLVVKRVQYHGGDGGLIQSYLDEPLKIPALGTTEFLVPEKDVRGGSGASFVVEWAAEAAVNPPLIEAIMVGASGQQGISLTSRGVVISNGPRVDAPRR